MGWDEKKLKILFKQSGMIVLLNKKVGQSFLIDKIVGILKLCPSFLKFKFPKFP